MEQLGSHGTNFHENWRSSISMSRKLNFDWNIPRITGTLHEDVRRIVKISRCNLLRKRNISDNIVQKINTHNPNNFLWKLCFLWDNVEKYGTARQATDDNIIRRMRFACWITKGTETHSEYVIFAFAQQQWLSEGASMSRSYVLCLSCFYWRFC